MEELRTPLYVLEYGLDIALWEVKSVPKVPYIGLCFDQIPRFDYCTVIYPRNHAGC